MKSEDLTQNTQLPWQQRYARIKAEDAVDPQHTKNTNITGDAVHHI
jgi:hypothetical protein